MKRCPQCAGACLPTQAFCPACGSPLQTAALIEGDPYLGTVFASSYLIQEKLGEGGMGAVYKAETIGVGRTVAIKVLHERFSGDHAANKRFEREAKVASRLNHPNSISILDFGHTATGLSFLVMEFLRGKGLSDVMSEEDLHLPRAVSIMRQILSALESAHALGIVHRDLKPGNIFLIANSSIPDHVKVLDFGIAHIRRSEGIERVTRTGMVCGTPEYMSPEQARGQDTDARSDVYSAGVVFYEMLTGRRPFESQSPAEVMALQIHKDPVPPSQRSPKRNIPPSLDAIVMWALAKRPDERFPSAREFQRVLGEWIQVSEEWLEQSGPPACPECGTPLVKEQAGGSMVAVSRCPECGHRAPSEAPTSHEPISLTSSDILESMALPDTESRADTMGAGFRMSPPPTAGRAPSEWFWTCPPPADAAFVGRKSLMSFLEASVAKGGFQVFRFSGPPGVGKTRVAEELAARAAAEGRKPVRGAPPSWAVSEPLETIQGLAVQLLDLPCEPVDTSDLAAHLEEAGMLTDKVDGLASLFGLEPDRLEKLPAAQVRLERADAWRRLVVECARRQPLVILLSEMELLDGASKELVLALAATETEAPVTLLLTHDESFFGLWPERCRHVEVVELDLAESETLARRMAKEMLSEARIQEAAEKSGGNPLHLREAVAFACLHPNDDPPDRLADLIAARANRLPPDAKHRLQASAIISRIVRSDVLAGIEEEGTALPGLEAEVEVDKSLQLLERAGLLVSHPPHRAFAHELHRRVITSGIPAGVRTDLHRKAARILGTQSSTELVLSHHHWKAGTPHTAIPHLLGAGREALLAYDEEDAELCYRRVLEAIKGPDATLAGAHGGDWVEAVRGLAAALQRSGQEKDAAELLDAAVRRVERIGWAQAKQRLRAPLEGGPEEPEPTS
jgi:serine/threonine-protein kinase